MSKSFVCTVFFQEEFQDIEIVDSILNQLSGLLPNLQIHAQSQAYQLSFAGEFPETPYDRESIYSDSPAGQAAQLIEELVALPEAVDFDFSATIGILPLNSGELLRGDFGSASPEGWEENMPEHPITGELDFLWNHTQTRFPQAIEKAKAPDPSRNYPGLDTSLGKDATNIRMYQLDTGWSEHTKLKQSSSYLTKEARNFVGRAIGGKANSKDSLKSFPLPAPQSPGHGTSTAHTIIGGKPSDIFKGELTPVDQQRHPWRFREDLGGGLFPYIHFFPMRAANRVVLNFNRGNSQQDVLEAVKYACANGADVITMSMGGDWQGTGPLKEAAEFAFERGVIFVCAAGNSKIADFLAEVVEPAQQAGTIAVAGIEPRRYQKENGDIEFRMYPWEKGCDGPEVDVSAPARYIYTAFVSPYVPDGAFKFGGATSQATAHVAAAAALWRHYFQQELQSPWYAEKPSRIVLAFKWALKHSMDIPDNWEHPESDRNVNRKLRNAKANNKGILDVEALLDLSISPSVFEELKEERLASHVSPQLRLSAQNPRGIVFNCKESEATENDWDYDTLLSDSLLTAPHPTGAIKETVDLRAPWWKVANQGITGSCVGWAVADSLLRWHLVQEKLLGKGKDEKMSVRFVWMAAKETDQFTNPPTTFLDASGTSLKAALDVVRRYGCVEEKSLPFDSPKLFPGDEKLFYSLASHFKIKSYYNLNTESPQQTIENWKRWLSTHGPILTRIKVDRNFYRGGIQGQLQQYERTELYGGHAVVLVGFDADHFIVRNSWGEDWGDQGFAYASYSYATDAFDESYGIRL